MTDVSEGDFRGAGRDTSNSPTPSAAFDTPSGDALSGDAPPFARVAIVGVGLMGGSLARAIRVRWPGVAIVGVDRADVIAQAREAGAIDGGAADAGAAVAGGAELILLAAPVLQNIAALPAIAAAASDGIPAARTSRPLLVTDLGSTKRAIVEAARRLPPSVTFIGGHPMAGAAQGGFAASRADLFRGRPWILTLEPEPEPDSADSPESAQAQALRRLEAFIRAIGGEPVVMSAAEHDRVMAHVSHLPQLVASALMRTIGPQVGAAGLAVSGPGLADTTRLASSPSGVWRDICQTNAEPIGAALDALIADLQQVRARLATPEALAGWIESWLDEGGRWRSQVPNGRSG